MNAVDIILIIVIAAVLFFALRRTIRARKSGGCGCGCANCAAKCDKSAGGRGGDRKQATGDS